MKTIWKPEYPLTVFLVAESDADRIMVAAIRQGKNVVFYSNAPADVFDEVRKANPDNAERGERVAKVLMGDDQKCSRHPKATTAGCADCLGMVAFQVKVTGDRPAEPEVDPFSDTQDDIPF